MFTFVLQLTGLVVATCVVAVLVRWVVITLAAAAIRGRES